ncbi:hypothetical protein [Delftia sp. PS-11]|uniref:hypothetical protein n=1 Tax=Delftia sp. PS-11 TaxID=2767222 RepID=UPI002453874D|nr:hypothetical protein [Delftia sp. PS-11]KAJ8745483.1 hypothetical protein H9T68_06720 [Delftia sp. PS-11]
MQRNFSNKDQLLYNQIEKLFNADGQRRTRLCACLPPACTTTMHPGLRRFIATC